MSHALPTDVQTLLRVRIGSYEQLHILLFLFQERTEWSAELLATHFNLSEGSTSEALSALVMHGLVATISGVTAPKYRYVSGAHDPTVKTLARVYQEQPLSVIRLLDEQSFERIRAFADAFLFRKDK